MFKKGLTLTGAILLGLSAVIALVMLLAPPTQATLAAIPPGCVTIDQNITVYTTWNASCYHVTTNTVKIESNAVLTISPPTSGMIVYFQTGAQLQVAGKLLALGTTSDTITFTSASLNPQPGDWAGIILDQNGGGDRIEHATIEYAQTGIKLNDEDRVSIRHNLFRYNGGSVTYPGGIGGDTDLSHIASNTFFSCTNGIILNEATGNVITDNVVYDSARYGIAFVYLPTVGGDSNIVSNNEVHHCGVDGLRFERSHNNIITGNRVYECGGAGIWAESSNSNQVWANEIYNCSADGIRLENGSNNQVLTNTIHSTMLTRVSSGAAIYLSQQGGAIVQANHLYNNGGGSGYLAAIYVANTPDLGVNNVAANVVHDTFADAVEYASINSTLIPPIVTRNALCAATVGTYELRNNTTLQADARYNWWSTNMPPTDAIFGQANYTPWITLSIPASDAYGVVTVTLRGQEGASFFTVPRTPTDLPADSSIPDARRVALTANWGHFEPSAVLIDDQGIATAQFVPSGVGPLPARIIVTATDFCGYAVPHDLPLPDLAITKTALTTQTVVGGLVTYRIEYANEGDVDAAGLLIRDTLPMGMQWVADTAVPPWTRSEPVTPPEIVWTLQSLAAGARGSFLVTTTVNTANACGLQLTNLAVITGTTLEARLDNNADSAAPVTVLCPSIEITKTGPSLSKVTDPVTYTYEIRNTSLPASTPPLDVVSIVDTGAGWPGLGDLTAQGCTPLATGASCTFQVPYTVAAGVPDPLVNVVTATYRLAAFNQTVTATDSHSVDLFQPAITFSKTGDPLSKVGDSVTYTLTLDNASSADTPDLQCRVTDALLGLDQAVTLAWNAAPYVIVRAFTVPAGAPDPLVNTANVTCSPTGFPNVITATDSHTVNLFQPAVQVQKSGPAEAHPGDTINYTFRITNTGSVDSPNLILGAMTDVGVGWPGLGNLTSLATTNGCTPLAAGAACMFTVPYAIPASTPNGYLTNTVSVLYHPLGFANSITDTDAHAVAITGAVDIVVIKDDNVGPITNTLMSAANQAAFDAWRETAGALLATAEPYHRAFVFDGDLVTYTISVVNVGAVPAANVVLTETLPLYTSYIGHGWTLVSGRTYTLNVGTLPPGEGVVRYFVVRVNEPLPADVNNLDNLVCGWSSASDATPADNCNHEDTPVMRRPQIEKTFTSSMAVAGQVISFTITYTNPNDTPLAGVRITDTLPPDTVWHSDTATSGGWTRLATTPEIVWYTPTLGAGASGRFVLNVIYDPAIEICDITLTNTVTLTVLNADTPYFADADTATFTIRCPSDLVVIKDDSVGPTTPFAVQKQTTIERLLEREVSTMGVTQHREFIYEGDLVTYTIAIENVGPYTATNVILTEILPLYTDYVGYDWTLVSGRTYTMALGTLAPGQGGIYYFVVRAHDVIPEGVNNLINYVCGWSREPDYHPDDNCNYEDTPLRRRPLRVSKTAPRCIAPGDDFYYSIFYTNTNTTTGFTSVPITDTLSPYLIYGGSIDWTCTGQTCRTTIGSIPAATYNRPGPLLPVQLSPAFSYTADSRIVNTIEISGGYRYILTSTVDLGPDLVVAKNDNIGPQPLAQQAVWEEITAQLGRPATTQSTAQRLYARPGEIITYTIVYVNSGVGTANNVVITERLPAYTRYIGGGWTHTSGPYYTKNLGALAPKQGDDLTFIVEVIDPFPLGVDRVINEVRIATTDEECDTSNNVSYDDTPIRTDTLLYVANRTSNTIDVFQTTDFAYLTSIPTGDAPFGMVVVDDQLYVANATSSPPSNPSQVQVFDLATHNVITSVASGFGTLYLTELDGYVYATDHSVGGEGVTVIEHTTHNVVARLKPDMPVVYDWGFFGITADPTRHQVYTTKRYMGAQGLWTITSTLTPLDFGLKYNLNTGDNLPYSTIYNRATDHVYVTFPHLHELHVYDPDDFSQWSVFPTQQQAPSPDSTDGGKGMAVMGECVYNANFAAQSVSVLAEGLCNDYSLTGNAVSTTFAPQDTFLLGFQVYLPLVMRDWVSYPNVTHIPVGGSPKGLAAGGGIVFVTLPEQNRVAVIDTRQGRVVYWIPTQGTYPHTAVIVYDAPWLDQ